MIDDFKKWDSHSLTYTVIAGSGVYGDYIRGLSIDVLQRYRHYKTLGYHNKNEHSTTHSLDIIIRELQHTRTNWEGLNNYIEHLESMLRPSPYDWIMSYNPFRVFNASRILHNGLHNKAWYRAIRSIS